MSMNAEISLPKHEAVVMLHILGQVAAGNSVESLTDEARLLNLSLDQRLKVIIPVEQEEL